LNKLGKPRKALAQFRAYLDAMPSGPLAEEAVYGMSLAYKKLGRRDDEQSTLKNFVKKYPKSQLYSEATRRLDALSR
jgi:TolA-binding protein